MDNKKYAEITEVKSVDSDNRIIEFIATKEIVDYDNDIVKVDGLDISKMKKNKSFLWSHKQGDPPVGKVISLKKDGKQLLGKAQMTSEEEYPFGYTIYKLIKGGYINNVSISFMPDYDSIEHDEKKGKQVRTIAKSTLLEISAVNVGANSAAMVSAKSFKDAANKAWDAGEIDGLELEEIEKKCVIEEEPEINKTNDEIAELKAKNAELELKVLEQKMEIENEEDDYLSYIFKEYFGTSSDESQHIEDHTEDDELSIDNII